MVIIHTKFQLNAMLETEVRWERSSFKFFKYLICVLLNRCSLEKLVDFTNFATVNNLSIIFHNRTY